MLKSYFQNGNVLRCIFTEGVFTFTIDGTVNLSLGMPLEELYLLLNVEQNKEIKQIEINKSFNNNLDLLTEKNGSYYFENIPVALPEVMVKFIHEKKWQNFWRHCSMIPFASNRENFFNYIQANEIIVTENGMVCGFRASDKAPVITEQIVREYQRIKHQKKSTNVNFYVDSICGDIVPDEKGLINLKEIYPFAEKGVICLSSHTGQRGKAAYCVGMFTGLDDKDVDYSSAECSEGLHLHNGKHTTYYGDTKHLVMYHPADLVNAPYSDLSKLRVKRLLVVEEIPDFQCTEFKSDLENVSKIVEEDFLNRSKAEYAFEKGMDFKLAKKTVVSLEDLIHYKISESSKVEKYHRLVND